MTYQCEAMSSTTKAEAFRLLNEFLRGDAIYLESSAAYGDGGEQALASALELFLTAPEHGFVWLVNEQRKSIGVCVVCYAISTSIGGIVAKLDDVYVTTLRQRRGAGTYMLEALFRELRRRHVLRIDTSVHESNRVVQHWYERLGFDSLAEQRLARIL